MEKFSCHYEAEVGRGGRSILDIRPLLWTLDGWPVAGENVKDGTYQIRSQRMGTILQVPADATNGVPAQAAPLSKPRPSKSGTSPRRAKGFIRSSMPRTGWRWKKPARRLRSQRSPARTTSFESSTRLSDGSYRIVAKAGKLALTALTKPSTGREHRPATVQWR